MSNAQALQQINEALAELKKTQYGWPKNNKPVGHMKNVVTALNKAKAALVPPHDWIKLGPVFAGGSDVDAHDMTHITDGLTALGSCWPAFDELHKPGSSVLAPEPLTITRWGSAQGGEALYATGESGLLYWFGHIDRRKPVGVKVKRGAVFAKVSAEHPEPHCHVAIDARPVIGHDFLHHTDYSHGAPIISKQLRAGGH